MATIKTMNNISKKGLSLFGSFYQVSDSIEKPDAILVRSAQVDTDNFDGLLAVARAGAGVNNITIDKASAKGICVFNTPGANANAVAELVMTVLGMAVRNVDKAAAWVKSLDVNDPDLAKTVESGKKKFAGMELAGKTLGVIGLGKNRRARRRTMPVGRTCACSLTNPYPNAANMHELSNKVETATLDEVIAKSDFLTVHVPFIKGVPKTPEPQEPRRFQGQLHHELRPWRHRRDGPGQRDARFRSLQGYLCDFPDADLIKNDKVTCFPHLGASTEEAEENCAVMAVEELKDYIESVASAIP
jgi:Phosphoglycerate dehydrogenase and related dehydrogenases